MTEISHAAWAKFRALIDASSDQETTQGVFARFIQEVSDAAKQVRNCPPSATPGGEVVQGILAPFILPDPVDPLAEALTEALISSEAYHHASPELVQRLRDNITKRGLQIVPAQS